MQSLINPHSGQQSAGRNGPQRRIVPDGLCKTPQGADQRHPGAKPQQHFSRERDYGDRRYPGHGGGNLIKNLLWYFNARSVFDPLTVSGTCRDVCRELGIYCWSNDLHQGADPCDPSQFPRECFEFCWIHPPYRRRTVHSGDPRDMSRTPTLAAFLDRYKLLIENCAGSLIPRGKLAILMGDFSDLEAGHVLLVHHTKLLAMQAGLGQHCTDIIRLSQGASKSETQTS